jgi:hypothetical protein
MLRRSILFLIMTMFLSSTGCIKETYDMNKLSNKDYLSPTVKIPAVNGNVTFSELNINLNVRINGLQIIDTLDNFLKLDGLDKDNPLKPENFEMLGVAIVATNGFPLDVSVQMSLYNSSTHTIKSTFDTEKILEAAPVNSSGKVSTANKFTKEIKFTRNFLSSIPQSDKIIFQFTFSTPNNGSNFVSIYSDYRIYFNVALVMKPAINLK